MKKFISLMFLLAMSVFATGCGSTGTEEEVISVSTVGSVLDQDGVALSDVRVVYESLDVYQVVFTDEEGNYNVDVPEGDYSVLFELEGCESVTSEVTLFEGDSTEAGATLSC